MTTATEMARHHGIDPKRYRQALRAAGFQWHTHNQRWEVWEGSEEHDDMVRVLSGLIEYGQTPRANNREKSAEPETRSRSNSDEEWIIDISDQILGQKGLRQHRFPFLLGDPGRSGRRMRLPVDAYYPDLGLVIEYHERQHSKPVALFNKRTTVSGVDRGEQRRLYDERRRDVLPKHGIELVVLDYSEFECSGAGRLLRTDRGRETAERVVRQRLEDRELLR